MKTKIKIEKEVELKKLIVHAGVRYWEDADVDGVEDENGDLIPCRSGDNWEPIIDIDTGVIENWKQGVTADIHYKVCDACGWEIKDETGTTLLSESDGYVPDTLCPNKNGYGDYIKMTIDENGAIQNWKFKISDFIEED